jgi:hypothetical protein
VKPPTNWTYHGPDRNPWEAPHNATGKHSFAFKTRQRGLVLSTSHSIRLLRGTTMWVFTNWLIGSNFSQNGGFSDQNDT